MAITPNYSWPLPDDTDLVKDGAEAIRDLGNAIDTTVDGLPGAGLVHINTTTATSVTAVNFNNVFSADYNNYMVTFEVTSVGSQEVNIRFRASGTDASGANYAKQRLAANNTGVAGARVTGGTSAEILASRTSGSTTGYVHIFNPFQSLATSYISKSHDPLDVVILVDYVGNHSLANSYDGFTVLAGANISGTFRVYGLRN